MTLGLGVTEWTAINVFLAFSLLVGLSLLWSGRRGRKTQSIDATIDLRDDPGPSIIPEPAVKPADAGSVDLRFSLGEEQEPERADLGDMGVRGHQLRMEITGFNPTCILQAYSQSLEDHGMTLNRTDSGTKLWRGTINSMQGELLGSLVVRATAPQYWLLDITVAPNLPLQSMAEQAIVQCGYTRNQGTRIGGELVRNYLTDTQSHIRVSVGDQVEGETSA